MLKNKNYKIDIDALSDVVRFIEDRRKQKNATETSNFEQGKDSVAGGCVVSGTNQSAEHDNLIIVHRDFVGGES